MHGDATGRTSRHARGQPTLLVWELGPAVLEYQVTRVYLKVLGGRCEVASFISIAELCATEPRIKIYLYVTTVQLMYPCGSLGC